MKIKEIPQLKKWNSDFGKKYTNRNIYSPAQLDKLYIQTWGVSRSQMIKEFLMPVKKDVVKVLEVGCNVGNQLRILQKFGFPELYGIEVQSYAIEKAKKITKNISIIKGSALDIPFKDGYFDLVFTADLLIHIPPKYIYKALDEIYRCAKKYIWGFEYFSEYYTAVEYRGNRNLLWKTDFSKLYLKRFNKLKIVKFKKYKYIHDKNSDAMFLFKKGIKRS